MSARMTVGNLVRSGRLIPKPCKECGTEKVEAHHPRGYDGPNALRVWWLCSEHHRALHLAARHARAKASGDMTLKEAAAILGTSPDNLRGAIARGAMKARKLGRDWIVTPAEVERYRAEHRRV